jgi:hypothetical protein
MIAVALLAVASTVQAENFFFPTQEGLVLIHGEMDKKGRNVNGYRHTTIKNVEGADGNFTVTAGLEMFNKKRSPTGQTQYRIRIVDGAIEVGPHSFVDMSLYSDDDTTIVVTGDVIRIPSDMSPGQRFNDANMSITADMVFFKLTTNIAITDHQCLAVETITTPAGTFEAYKTTQKAAIGVGRARPKTTTTVTWNVKGIGPVRTIVYDHKGKVESWTDLLEIRRP